MINPNIPPTNTPQAIFSVNTASSIPITTPHTNPVSAPVLLLVCARLFFDSLAMYVSFIVGPAGGPAGRYAANIGSLWIS
jgi:hypothetical protein